MIRRFCSRSFELAKGLTTRSRKCTRTEEPSSPTKRRTLLSYLCISLYLRRALLFVSRLQRWGDSYGRKDVVGRVKSGVVVMGSVDVRHFQSIKWSVLVLVVLNFATLAIAVVVAFKASSAKCPRNLTLAAVAMVWGPGVRLMWMIGMAFAQVTIALTLIAQEEDASTHGGAETSLVKTKRRYRYKCWLWWSRLGIIVTVIQAFGVCYFAWFLARNVSIHNRQVTFCPRDGEGSIDQKWLMSLMLILPTLGGILVCAQCCVGSDVLSWRLLYGQHYEAWRSHYRQMFDHGIREVLCCLGRRRYMSVKDEDEVDSVAAMLGDLVAYRAVGASHLEVIAGVALLKEQTSKISPEEEFQAAPHALIAEATVLHPYAVAAYTGPLLDVGRNPLTFPCTWLYRQGVLSPWTRNRRPALEGDNWWRGHAAAFLKFAQLPPEALRQGRVSQTNREAVYFVVVLHEINSVLVAIRGTETPEDLLTDGLGRESTLTKADLCGFLTDNTSISEKVRQDVLDTMPHFGHVGVIEAARELALQLDNLTDVEEIGDHPPPEESGIDSSAGSCPPSPNKQGLLTSLLGPGAECEGYSLRLVGHSLGGAIAALTGLRLSSRYPSLHVYTFGVLPCVDLVIAEACSTFTTSIVYNDEFASRLSLAAVMRLRAAALRALAADADTDADLVTKLTHRLFKSTSKDENGSSDPVLRAIRRRSGSALKGTEIYDEEEGESLMNSSDNDRDGQEEQEGTADLLAPVPLELLDNGMPKDMPDLGSPSRLKELWPAELFVPGLIIHIIRTAGSSKWFHLPKPDFYKHASRDKPRHVAVMKDRKYFREIRVSPAMFIDHMPWKCQYALNEILERQDQGNIPADSLPHV